jgi:hypothetical protein
LFAKGSLLILTSGIPTVFFNNFDNKDINFSPLH